MCVYCLIYVLICVVLGRCLEQQGKIEKAEIIFQEAMVDYEQVCGVNHTSTLRAKSCYASLLTTKGDLDAAEGLYRHILDVRVRICIYIYVWLLYGCMYQHFTYICTLHTQVLRPSILAALYRLIQNC